MGNQTNVYAYITNFLQFPSLSLKNNITLKVVLELQSLSHSHSSILKVIALDCLFLFTVNIVSHPFIDPRSLPEIQESIRNAIGGNISVFSLAFGRNADYGFLDVLSKQNNGIARRIYEDSDAPLQLKVEKFETFLDPSALMKS